MLVVMVSSLLLLLMLMLLSDKSQDIFPFQPCPPSLPRRNWRV